MAEAEEMTKSVSNAAILNGCAMVLKLRWLISRAYCGACRIRSMSICRAFLGAEREAGITGNQSAWVGKNLIASQAFPTPGYFINYESENESA